MIYSQVLKVVSVSIAIISISVILLLISYSDDNYIYRDNLKSDQVRSVIDNKITTSDLCGENGSRSPRLSYRAFHDKMVRGKVPPRFLIFECLTAKRMSCGGQADRFKGIMSAFFLALSTNRALMINIDTPMPMERMLYPNNIAWNFTDSDSDLFDDKFTSTDWIWRELRKHKRETNYPKLVDILEDYVRYKFKFPVVRLTNERNALKILSTNAPIIRISTNEKLKGTKLQTVWDRIQEHNRNYSIKPNLMVYDVFEYLKKKSDTGCIFRYLFIPSVSVMARLHATAIDLTLQLYTHNSTNDLPTQYTQSMKLPQVQTAMQEFTQKYYQELITIPVELKTFSASNKLRSLMMTLSTVYGSNPEAVFINHIACIHYRVGGNKSGFQDTETRGYINTVPQFKDVIDKHMKNKVGNYKNSETLVVYLSDNAATRGTLRTLLKGYMYASPSFWVQNKGAIHIARSKKADPFQTVEVFSEALLLGMCDSYVLNKSAFGRLGHELSFKNPEAVRSQLRHQGHTLQIQS